MGDSQDSSQTCVKTLKGLLSLQNSPFPAINFSICWQFQMQTPQNDDSFLPQASLLDQKKARGDVPDVHPDPNPESEPTSPVSDFENSYNYVCECLCLVQHHFGWK